MSEITREQVERLVAGNKMAARGQGSLTPMSDVLGPAWREVVPDYVLGLCNGAAKHSDWPLFIAALEGWLSTFPPVDHRAELERMATPAPAEDSPERLRQRREAHKPTPPRPEPSINREERVLRASAAFRKALEEVEYHRCEEDARPSTMGEKDLKSAEEALQRATDELLDAAALPECWDGVSS